VAAVLEGRRNATGHLTLTGPRLEMRDVTSEGALVGEGVLDRGG